jgi:NAD+ kinase
MHVAIFGKKIGEEFLPVFSSMISKLRKCEVEIWIYKPFYDFLSFELKYSLENVRLYSSHEHIQGNVDMVISVGGDGTFLDSVMVVRDSGIPIVGINSGRLGFLANIASEDIDEAIDDVINGNYSIESRQVLKLEATNGQFSEFHYALNDLTVQKSDNLSMITVHVYVNEEYLASYWADGLIVATPTGSTAYSLSAGGPIVVPGSDALLITPICPHNLTFRPVMVPFDNKIRLKVEGRSSNFLVSLDSRSEVFTSQDEFVVTKADFSISVLKLKGHDFYTTLRNKLMWGADKRN